MGNLVTDLGHLATLGGPVLWLIAALGLAVWTVIVDGLAACWLLRDREELGRHLGTRLWLLRILASVAPLVGLLGTVSGIIVCFTDLSTPNGRHLAAGIAESLLCTAAGLLVAVPAVVAHAVMMQHRAMLATGQRSP